MSRSLAYPTRGAGIFACLCVLHAAGALAQWNPSFTAGLGRGYGSIALSQSVISNTRRIGANDTQTPPKAAATPTFTSDPAVSDQTRADVIDALSRESPQLRPQMEQAFAGNRVLKNFDRYAATHGGYSSHNVADSMALLLVISWEIITGTTANNAQVRGAHRQVRDIFLNTPQLRAMTNVERQQMSERIAYQVMISSTARDEFQRHQDSRHLAELRASATGVMRQQGIELSGLRLTDRGFSR